MALSIVQAVTGLRLNASRPDRLPEFYVAALGFRRTAQGVTLGETAVTFAQATGAPYPHDVLGWSPLFQHFAIVTADMPAAFAQLSAVGGWTAITHGEPRVLPASSGGVAAFKFRDPDGHPLELIAFPGTPSNGCATMRIDHSAVSVRDTARSVRFYRELGFVVAGGSFNQGEAQDNLDGLAVARVEVTALRPTAQPHPHLELLAYCGDFLRGDPAGLDGVAATRLRLQVRDDDLATIRSAYPNLSGEDSSVLLRDPEGHLLEFHAGP